MNIPPVLERLSHRYPSFLVDAVTDPRARAAGSSRGQERDASNEEFFQGHFPGTPLMPGVLMIESLSQVATLLLFGGGENGLERASLRGVDHAKFRRQVVPGDRLELEITMGRRRGPDRAGGDRDGGRPGRVAEADLVMAIERRSSRGVPATRRRSSGITAVVHPNACIGAGTVVGPYVTIGEHVIIGRNCTVGASSIVDGWTTVGDRNQIFPMASIGLAPQDLKYKGEPTRLTIGPRNVFREFVTIHRGTMGGGGETTIGDHNFFMAYAHVAHDCHIGNHTIFGNAATLGGHVTVEDYATISAYSGVHQFCRVGQHAFIGGYTVVTRDALPYAKTVGNRARIYGLNPIGLARRGFSAETISKLRRAYRHLLQHNTSRAIEIIEKRSESLQAPEVQLPAGVHRTAAQRGVILRRLARRVDDLVEGE